ncbi:MAG: aminotransferase class I/II-fold pyridoxal phosphate-dependent enzyme [Blastocatellia bacterium]|nr:aminotransferase class I/II-fold pyridoxal phosphate-dependent enzyme [Blastocatellia bacterium]
MKRRIDTKAVHSGDPRPRLQGSIVTPIFQTAMYEYNNENRYPNRYIRLNNTPNQLFLNEKLSALEEAEAAMVMTSGMAAISTTLFSVLAPGGHLLCQEALYGGTYDLLTKDFADFGLSYDLIDATKPSSWKDKLKSNTKAIYVESVTNPLMQVADHKAVVEFAKSHGLVSIIDSTFSSPINFRPVQIGYDLVLHSCTKYLNGHSDIVAGAVIGKAELVEKISHKLNHFGSTLDPHAAFLLNRGLKTLAVRVRQQNQTALKLAQFLEQHPALAKVYYPGLESHPQHQIARELFDGFGGMLSFELKNGEEATKRLLERLEIPTVAPSLGGVESLIIRPSVTSHSGLTPQERHRAGISDWLLRLSVGLEAAEDLIEDFSQALV